MMFTMIMMMMIMMMNVFKMIMMMMMNDREAFQQNKSPSQVAEELCELSIKLGSSDNVTIVIVKFIHPARNRANR